MGKTAVHLSPSRAVCLSDFAPRAQAAMEELCGKNRLVEPNFWGDVFILNGGEGQDEPFREPAATCPGWHKDGFMKRHYLDSPATTPVARSAREITPQPTAPKARSTLALTRTRRRRPQLAAHSRGSYRIVMTKRQPEIPARCVCCYARKPATQWQLNSPSGKFQLPLCDDCASHQHAAKLGDKVTFWGMGR